jgi:outer membrane autotransporter protein
MAADSRTRSIGQGLRAATIFGAVLVALIGLGGGQARASAGCDAVNAGALNASTSTVKAVTGLAVGDTVTFNITTSGIGGWDLVSGTNVILAATAASGTQSYTVKGTNGDTTLEQITGNGVTVTATCVPAAASSSGRLRTLQFLVTNVEALTSGDAISSAVGGAIADGFADSDSSFIRQSGNGLHFNFAAEPDHVADNGVSAFDPVTSARESVRSDAGQQSYLASPWSRVNDTFGALAYANPMPTKAPPPISRQPKDWQVWADVRGTGWNTNVSDGDLVGGQVNALLGVTRRLTPDFLIGVLGGYETFDYSSNTLDGRLKGDGWTAGGYLGWRLWPGLRFDASVARSDLTYDATAGTDSGKFPASRWLASAGLTGIYKMGRLEIEPSAKVYALWEHDNQFTDSTGTLQAVNSFSTGRASGGVKFAYPWFSNASMTLAPYVGAYADYYFNTGVPPLLPNAFVEGWSGRVTAGLAYSVIDGAKVTIGGELGGLGNDFVMWSVRGRASVPF